MNRNTQIVLLLAVVCVSTGCSNSSSQKPAQVATEFAITGKLKKAEKRKLVLLKQSVVDPDRPNERLDTLEFIEKSRTITKNAADLISANGVMLDDPRVKEFNDYTKKS